MKGRASFLPLFRVPLTRQGLSLRFYNAPHAQTFTPYPTTTVDSMLGRARDKKATEPAPKAAAHNALKHQLFPSNSPSAPNGSIMDHLKKPGTAPSTAGFRASSNPAFKPPAPTKPLNSRSANITRDASSYPPKAWSGQSVATLCNNVGSFSDAPEAIPAGSSASGPIFINENDFSDDDDLDLNADFDLNVHRPDSLPSLSSHNPSQPSQQLPRYNKPAPMSNDSAIDWSQSSPSHMVHPTARAKQTPVTCPSIKRESPTEAAAAQPPKKRKKLPWETESVKTEIKNEIDEYSAISQTPVRKSKDSWLDATASVLKDKKKDIRQRSKKTAAEAVEIDEDVPSETKEPKATTSRGGKPAHACITLSAEQLQVKDLVCKNKASVFFTGPAGTGKSVLMRAIIQELKIKYKKIPERLAVTASTGLAACHIGGMTLHSFAGIGLGKESVQDLVKKIRRNPKAKNRWLKTQTLIIDEVSMVDGELFDKLSQIGRQIRNNGRPWGGIQLVITGDFFQLPPVPDGSSRESKFAFDAATWNTTIDHTIGLTEVFRQKDPVFANMLNEMRLGRITDQSVEVFKSLSRPLEFDDGLEVTELFPTRNEVESSNLRRLKALPGKSYIYDANDTGNPDFRDKLLQNMMAPKAMELKVGAQVMLIKNMNELLVNGSLGTVVGFMSESVFEISGGAGAGDSGDEGKSMHPEVKARIQAFSRQLSTPETKEYPLVRFHATDGTSTIILAVPEEWKVELPTGEIQASRKQLPLILAWALSIHKAQGQTLERVKVDLGKVFEKGQAYVALSRAVSQQGLQVLRFQKQKVMAHPKVVQFYNQLYTVDTAMGKRKPTPTLTSYTSALGSKPASAAQAPAPVTKKPVPVATKKPAPPAKKFTMPVQPWEVDEDEEEFARASYGHY